MHIIKKTLAICQAFRQSPLWLRSAPPGGRRYVWPATTLHAKRPLQLGARLKLKHNCIVLRCPFQDDVKRHLVVKNRGTPACWFSLQADERAGVYLAPLFLKAQTGIRQPFLAGAGIYAT